MKNIQRGRVIVIFTLLLVFGVSLFLLYRFSQPAQVPRGTPNSELLLLSNRDGRWDIYALDSSGQMRNVTRDPAGAFFASWSFDSEQINFLSARTGEMGPAQVRPDGSDARNLDILSAVTTLFFEGRLDWDPQWSPDGTRLLWASVRDLNLELYIADVNGDNSLRLTNHPGRDWFALWSPDSQQIVFNSDRDGNENLYRIDANGDNLIALTDDAADDIRAVWSLDGEQLLFVSERKNPLTSGILDLYIMDTDGENEQPLEGIFEGGLTRSPDGSQIVYMSNLEGRWHIYAAEENCTPGDASCVRRLTEGDADFLFPVWRPS